MIDGFADHVCGVLLLDTEGLTSPARRRARRDAHENDRK